MQPAEIDAAVAQASQFSQVCNVWAPMYRQATEGALKDGAAFRPAVIATAYDSVLSAWKDFLAHDDDGKPIVFIGHSQGAAMLIELLRAQVDPSPTLRKRMVSAIILGGNVQVPAGRRRRRELPAHPHLPAPPRRPDASSPTRASVRLRRRMPCSAARAKASACSRSSMPRRASRWPA